MNCRPVILVIICVIILFEIGSVEVDFGESSVMRGIYTARTIRKAVKAKTILRLNLFFIRGRVKRDAEIRVVWGSVREIKAISSGSIKRI